MLSLSSGAKAAREAFAEIPVATSAELAEADAVLENYLKHYTDARILSALDYLQPSEFGAARDSLAAA